MSDEAPAKCSFCDNSMDDVYVLLEGRQGAYICDQCVVTSAKMLRQKGTWPSLPVRLFRTLRYWLRGGSRRSESK